MSDEIKNCPFCGTDERNLILHDRNMTWIKCRNCKAAGPKVYKYNKVTTPQKEWNERVRTTYKKKIKKD